MNTTADTIIKRGIVRCSRCGSAMHAEHLWAEGNEGIPLLLWRCDDNGHITQAVPIPEAVPRSRFIAPRLDYT